MAIKGLLLACDWCDEETHEFEDIYEAANEGWFFLTGPHPFDEDEDVLEKAYCSRACLTSDIAV